MKWLLVPLSIVLLAVGYLGTELQDLHKRCDVLEAQNEALNDIIRTRTWVDRQHFSMAIANLQWLNYNTAVRRPSIKEQVDRFEEYWEFFE